jgi:lipopolysaccharide transport system ATP-binding protein
LNTVRAAIDINGLTKTFPVYRTPSDMLLEFVTGRQRHTEFVALDNISFEVQRGQVLGIVGRNGAGKSTLLKIIAGTMMPTRGSLRTNGRVSAILELGVGFHNEYSGRENIYIGALCRGMKRPEIKEKIDNIIEFSELEAFIDKPLKTYSTGMQARLAFSVAIAVDSEILIVDEALSVGDAKFQMKCFSYFEQYRDGGGTILLVTHAHHLIQAVCDRALYLDNGKMKIAGFPKEVIGLYLQDLFGGSEDAATKIEYGSSAYGELLPNGGMTSGSRRYGSGAATIVNCALTDERGKRIGTVESGAICDFVCRIKCNQETIDDLNVGISIRTKEGVRIFGVNPRVAQLRTPELQLQQILEVKVKVRMNLGIGDYFVTFGAWGGYDTMVYDRLVDVLHFAVTGSPLVSQTLVNMSPEYSMSVLPNN